MIRVSYEGDMRSLDYSYITISGGLVILGRGCYNTLDPMAGEASWVCSVCLYQTDHRIRMHALKSKFASAEAWIKDMWPCLGLRGQL